MHDKTNMQILLPILSCYQLAPFIYSFEIIFKETIFVFPKKKKKKCEYLRKA